MTANRGEALIPRPFRKFNAADEEKRADRTGITAADDILPAFMLHEFLTTNRAELIARCAQKVSDRTPPGGRAEDMDSGVSPFLDQLIKTLGVEQTDEPMRSRSVSGPSGGGNLAFSEVAETAARHGRELLRNGYTIDQVVHDYGDLCQSITDLAFENDSQIEIDEFRTLNRCLDNAIAEAVTEYSYQRDFAIADRQVKALNVHLGEFAHEVRNQLNIAMLAFSAIKTGNVAPGGATGMVLDRSLLALKNLVNRSLSEVRVTAGLPVLSHLFSLSEFIYEIGLSAQLEADLRGCSLSIRAVQPGLAVDADRDLLSSAVGNLLHNAFKFTRERSEVTLKSYAAADRILIEVGDYCGGLAGADPEGLFRPFAQTGADRTGVGLGLSISRRSVEANNGTLTVRDFPGSGCVFTIDLPRHAMPIVP